MSASCGQLLRIDLSSGRVGTEPIDPETARKFIGGRRPEACRWLAAYISLEDGEVLCSRGPSEMRRTRPGNAR